MGAAVLARTAPQAEQTERTKPDTVHEPRGGQIKQENFTAFLIALTAPLNRTRTLWHLRRSHACGLMGALLSDRPTVEASHQRIGAKHQEQFFEVLPPPKHTLCLTFIRRRWLRWLYVYGHVSNQHPTPPTSLRISGISSEKKLNGHEKEESPHEIEDPK